MSFNLTKTRDIKASRLVLLLGYLLLVFASPTYAVNSVELMELGFFEGEPEATLPDWDSPDIKTSFDKLTARNIFTLIKIKNHLLNQQDQVVKIDVRYLRSDGSQVGERSIETHLPKEWGTLDLQTGWGWESSNQWGPDFYKVELWLNNNAKIGEGFFQIKADTRTITKIGNIELDRMGFYEAGEDGDEQAPDEWDDRRMRNNFDKSDARYIYTMVSLKNLKWEIEDQDVNIRIRYYYSDGKLFGDPEIDYLVPKDWEYAELWNGWGWTEAGNWKPDRYRVELWVDNKKKIGESYFTVH